MRYSVVLSAGVVKFSAEQELRWQLVETSHPDRVNYTECPDSLRDVIPVPESNDSSE